MKLIERVQILFLVSSIFVIIGISAEFDCETASLPNVDAICENFIL